MNMTLKFAPFAVLALLAGCSHDHDHAAAPTTTPAAAGGAAAHEHVHGDRIALGELKLGAHVVQVFQVAPIVAGAEGDFDLDFAGALPVGVRGWIGAESGQGSRKVQFERETAARMHGHPEVPKPVADDARFWLEIDGAGRGSVALHR